VERHVETDPVAELEAVCHGLRDRIHADRNAVDDVLLESPKQVEQYKGGKTTVLGYLVGQAMKATRGQANPQSLNQLFKQKLDS